MFIRSYKSAFILLFTALLVITVVGVGANAYRRATRVSLDLSAEIIGEISNRIVTRTQRIFESAFGYLETNALLISERTSAAARDELMHLFWRQLQLEPQLESQFAASPGGSFVQVRKSPQLATRFIDRATEPAREQVVYRDRDYRPIAHTRGTGLYDPRGRTWYSGALAAEGRVTWSAVYRFHESGKPGVTASKAIYDGGGELLAVLGVDITLERLSDFLAEQQIAKGAVALIVDEQDQLAAFPYDLKLRDRRQEADPDRLPKLDELSDTWIVEAYRQLERERKRKPERADVDDAGAPDAAWHGYTVSTTDGVRYIARAHWFPSHWADGWRLVIVVPEASLLQSADRLLSESAAISIIMLIIAVTLAQVVGRRMFEPLHRLVHNTELIKQMRLAEVERVDSRFREIRSMDDAICGMRQSLQTLVKFVPAAVSREIIQSGQDAKPGGEIVELTLYVSSMAGFAALCHKLPPEEITRILTTHLDQFTRILLRHRGTLDNYLGEAILAFWGAPLPISNGPERACRAALACLQAERALLADESTAIRDASRNLFAIHRGRAIVGNIGSSDRLSYTAIGDHVGLSWRLKQLNHLYGTRIIVSETARREVAEQFWFRRLDRITVHDGSEKLELFELLGPRTEALDPARADFIRAYERGLEAVLAGDWAVADRIFGRLAEEAPDDRSVRLMCKRCQVRDMRLCPSGDDADLFSAMLAS